MRNSVILVGRIPPPLGGVTIHVARLKGILENSGYPVQLIDYSNIGSLIDIFKKGRGIYHLHISNDYFRFLFTLLIRIQNKKVVNTFHSYRNKNRIKRFIGRLTSNISIRNIAVGEQLYEELLREKFSNLFYQKSFIPPSKLELTGIKCDLEYRDKFVIGINAYSILLEEGKDIYGILTSLEMVKKLREIDYEVYLQIYIAGIKDEEFYKSIISYIKKNHISRFVKIIKGENLITGIPNLKLFIRPTLTDSYGVSISEAIYMGIPTIASNVCIRDKNAVLYNVNNNEELFKKIIEVINGENPRPNKDSNFNSKDYLESIYGINEWKS